MNAFKKLFQCLIKLNDLAVFFKQLTLLLMCQYVKITKNKKYRNCFNCLERFLINFNDLRAFSKQLMPLLTCEKVKKKNPQNKTKQKKNKAKNHKFRVQGSVLLNSVTLLSFSSN